jgi:hypothetical protein
LRVQHVWWTRKKEKKGTFLMNLALRPVGSGLSGPRLHDATSGYRRFSRRQWSFF